MSVTPARSAALRVLRAVRSGALADRALADELPSLEPRDRAWLQELVYGTLRLRGRLDHRLAQRLHRGLASVQADVLDVLRMGAYQRTEMRVPDYAAVSESVDLAREVGGEGSARLANGVLRGLSEEWVGPSLAEDPIGHLTTWGSHPRWLIERWVRRWGVEAVARLVAYDNTRPGLFLRPLGIEVDVAVARLADAGIEAGPVESLRTVRLGAGTDPAQALDVVPGVIQDPAAGCVVDHVAAPQDAVVADLCAAPGGKALGLAERGFVAAGDRTFGRVARLRENAARVGLPVGVLVADARAPALSADVVLVDVPCTGTGTLARHPDARWRLGPRDLEALVSLQREILEGAATAVRPGGLLVYATCSLEPEENEEQVERFLSDHPEFVSEAGSAPRADALDARGRLVVTPWAHGLDGAFAARLRRR